MALQTCFWVRNIAVPFTVRERKINISTKPSMFHNVHKMEKKKYTPVHVSCVGGSQEQVIIKSVESTMKSGWLVVYRPGVTMHQGATVPAGVLPEDAVRFEVNKAENTVSQSELRGVFQKRYSDRSVWKEVSETKRLQE